MSTLTQTYLKSLISYNPLTGVFIWKARPLDSFATIRVGKAWNTKCAGKAAGCVDKINGYLKISINDKSHRAHRLAWLYINGSMPVDEIDHINHDRLDNRIINLREATGTENHKNMSMDKRNKSGFTGVHWYKRASKWEASITVGGKLKYLGYFQDIQDAITAREQANVKYNFHNNHGLTA